MAVHSINPDNLHAGAHFRELLKRQLSGSAKRPAYYHSPFPTELFQAGTPVTLDGLMRAGIPELTFYTDTHLVAPHNLSESYESLSSGKRRFFGLSKFAGIMRNVNMLDDISYIMLRQIGPHIQRRYAEGGLVVHGGDIIDSYETSNCFRTFAELERFHGDLHTKAHPRPGVETRSIWITGNHDTFFGGIEKWFEYNQLKRQYGDFSATSFAAVVEALRHGMTWNMISEAWEATHKTKGVFGQRVRYRRALHPALRWYLEKLTFGPAQGMFMGGEERSPSKVYFLDSELMTLHGSVHTLKRALKRAGVLPGTQLYRGVVGFREQEYVAQRTLLESVHASLQQGLHVVVYGHNPRQLQTLIVEYVAGVTGAKNHNDGIRKMVEDNVTVYGGHFHTASRDIVKMPPGVRPVRGATRFFIGPFGQKPGRFPFTMSLDKYLDSLTPEIMDGPLDTPRIIPVAGVKDAFENALAFDG